MKKGLDRRGFCLGLGASAASRTILPLMPLSGAAVLSSIPGKAGAEAATAIAIGSAVVGVLSAMTASDGGVMGMLQASHARLGIIIEKLEDIQLKLADVITTLSRIDQVIAQELTAQGQREFHAELRTDIEAFRQLYGKWDPSLDQKQWLDGSRVKPELQDIRNRISRNTANARAASRFDAVTGLIESVYAFLDLSVAAMISYSPYELTKTAEIHIGWIDRITDFNQPGSAAASLSADGAEHARLTTEVYAGPVLKNHDTASGYGLHSCVGVNDYKPRRETRFRYPCEINAPRMPLMREKIYRAAWCDRIEVSPERFGPKDRISRRYHFKEIDAEESGVKLGYKLYELIIDDVSSSENQLRCDWAIDTLDMPDTTARSNHMRNMARFTVAENEFSAFRQTIAQLNTLRAKMALSSAAIAAVMKTKAALEQDMSLMAEVPVHLPVRNSIDAILR